MTWQMGGMQDAIIRAHASPEELREHQTSVMLRQMNEDIRRVESEVVHKESAAQEKRRAPQTDGRSARVPDPSEELSTCKADRRVRGRYQQRIVAMVVGNLRESASAWYHDMFCAKRIPEYPARAVATVGKGRASDELRQKDQTRKMVQFTRCANLEETIAAAKAYEDVYFPQQEDRERHKKPPRVYRIHFGALNDDSSQDMEICNAIFEKQ
ncbi:uncharacterized protein PHALS_03881 [Plasmopara halstedii]|uniref:Uncharacterized protein n=1 Tax=Plasmopara halstedii TaxID=4781 RepID=A0A0P1AXQ2_PLAHL|nr:uncharacterized protein PHALS_03881 [Plasmopara halstedii]CEG47234.1 hypothetical protein PHALS_03881 [Plasmopara halstedii]|eukprot:XP_024583603.1 hypothetical protein PHALS_03881 [Plasmopara halstedii]